VLREFTSRVLQTFGVPAEDAELAAGVLGSAALRGIDTHGVARLPQYVEMLAQGRIDPRPRIRTVRENAATAHAALSRVGLVKSVSRCSPAEWPSSFRSRSSAHLRCSPKTPMASARLTQRDNMRDKAKRPPNVSYVLTAVYEG
jgi:hypothetical protein